MSKSCERVVWRVAVIFAGVVPADRGGEADGAERSSFCGVAGQIFSYGVRRKKPTRLAVCRGVS